MVEPARLTGGELFSIGTAVRDFWSYALSNLQGNAARGYLAEYLVARAIGATGNRIEWDAYDVLGPDGTTIEVKRTARHPLQWAAGQAWQAILVRIDRSDGLRRP